MATAATPSIGSIIGFILLSLIAFLVFFLIIRAFVLWYYKIYKIVSELEDNNALLREIRNELKKMNAQTPESSKTEKDYSAYMPK